ncbi:Por secretion system C-terminal sorting domain-containing protein [Dyadobacter sp. SG02]|uniref:T9SS type A sorting domain-containing protein n=1 Tax=Dyadobacter sp. SG02 TaxID=1855291 RepID=UPI0008CF1219|nr:T9SS type A sorting domain-containing protein [Dyadobacter sp. SG02]SEJ80650.1 Por secretion system C-terminal sorting domain-containing protein [Dyadobacter sp. SG02]
MKSVYSILLLILLSGAFAEATHLKGGEIMATYVSAQSYKIRVRLYIDEGLGMVPEALSSVKVCMGDGNIVDLPRVVSSEVRPGGVRVFEYEDRYTFPSSGIFQISVASDQRSDNIVNLPNAGGTTQFIWTVIDTQVQNSTPVLPYLSFEAGVRQVFSIDLKPSIADNDSITARVVRLSRPSPGTCGVRMLDRTYLFPNEISASGTFKVDAAQKKLIWTAPEVVGNYLYAMVVVEWRDGAKISETYREGMVTVTDKPGETVEIPPYESSEYGGLITSTPVVSSPEVSMAIQAYPVPTENFVTVKAYSKQRDIIRLQLIDMNGRVLTEIASKIPEISVQEVFDMRNLAQGVYLIRASNAKDSVTQKVLR